VSEYINPLRAELNATYHLLALLGAHHILHVSRITVNEGKAGRKLTVHSTDPIKKFILQNVGTSNKMIKKSLKCPHVIPNMKIILRCNTVQFVTYALTCQRNAQPPFYVSHTSV
jgi:hypothetical protein